MEAMIREERVLDVFPVRIGPDLYLWIVRHHDKLTFEARDESVTTTAAKDDLVEREDRKPRRQNPLNIYS